VNDYLRAGTRTGRSIASTTRSTCCAASGPAARPARRRRSSTARASRARKRGRRIDPSGYDAGKKVKGKKRHVLVDTQGLLMQAIVHAADVQDRDGGVLLMGALFALYPFLLRLYADSGYAGPKFQAGLRVTCRQVNLEIVRAPTDTSSSCCPNAGSSSGLLPGSTAAAVLRRTGNA
jgi:hypothetical protein